MRLREFAIRHYGPLPDTGRVALDSFSLLFGRNEDGKTLTIDALVKLLFKRSSRRLFNNIDRVSGDPDGYLAIEDESGKVTKLPEEEGLADITDLTSEECRNIFIVRNSDLSIASESEFYRSVTERLTGLRTGEIGSIRAKLGELGKLTKGSSDASLRNLAGEKLKARVNDAVDLIEEIRGLEDKLEEEEYDRLEEELLDVREKVGGIESKLESFENARQREQYEKCSEAYEALTRAEQDLKGLEVYSEENARTWGECERDRRSLEEEMERLRGRIETDKGQLEQQREALGERQLEIQVLGDKKKRIDNEIEPEIRNYEMRLGRMKSGEAKGKFLTGSAIASASLLLVSMAGLVMTPAPVFYGFSVLFLVLAMILGAAKLLSMREKAHLAAVLGRIRLSASRFELGGANMEEILSSIQRFSEEYYIRESRTEEAEREVSSLQEEIDRLADTEIPALERRIREATTKIEGVAQEAEVRSLPEYQGRLKHRLACEQTVTTESKMLKSHLGSAGETPEENLQHWLDGINRLKDFRDKAKDRTHDEKAVQELKSAHGRLVEEEKRLHDDMTGFRDQLLSVERKANEILRLEDDYLHCSTSLDVKVIRDRLLGFVAETETTKEDALKAIRIFESLEREEEEKISTLFGKDSPVSEHFHEITGGLYEQVDFVLDGTKRVRVRLKDGSMLDAEQLSGGAYDQLYLSIRLALGEELLRGARGFFIMDDPFIKADKDRLRRQMDILRRICESGWQVIYFTAKDEVKDSLQQDIANGSVSYIEVQGTVPA